jgi:hypothetical protein
MSLHRGTTVLAITLLSVVLAIGFSSTRFASSEHPDPGSRMAQEEKESTAPTAAAARGDAPQTTALKVSVIHSVFHSG